MHGIHARYTSRWLHCRGGHCYLALPCASASMAATACCAADSGLSGSAAGDAAMLPAGASNPPDAAAAPVRMMPVFAKITSRVLYSCQLLRQCWHAPVFGPSDEQQGLAARQDRSQAVEEAATCLIILHSYYDNLNAHRWALPQSRQPPPRRQTPTSSGLQAPAARAASCCALPRPGGRRRLLPPPPHRPTTLAPCDMAGMAGVAP
jgi:hypothetical protein